MKTIILIFSMFISLSGCDDDNTDKQETPVIIGTWKLIKVEYAWNLGEVDYSKNNITYTFEPNGVLKVKGDPDVNYPSRTHKYEFGKFSNSPLDDSKILMVKIEAQEWLYSLNSGVMVLAMDYIDGVNLYFKKKQK